VNAFAIAQPATFDEAVAILHAQRFSLPVLKSGGMDVVDHLKEGLIQPDALINIKRVRRAGNPQAISMIDGKDRDPIIEIEATATMAEIASSLLLRKQAPVVSQALSHAATPQVRNVGTAAGNLLQRPRCWYYRNAQFDCLKKGGHTCFAVEGENRYHAIFSAGPCHIVHPSNLAPALLVCDGKVHVMGGKRDTLKIADLFHGPETGVASEHTLEADEVITHISLSPRPSSGFYAVKERQSFDWPLVMAAVTLELDGPTIRNAEVCAGAVAPVPMPLPRVGEALAGVRIDDDAALRKACDLASSGAKPMTDNAYKVRLLPVAVRRAVLRAAGQDPDAKEHA
jgi:xanthine dehydrogenase YagS FAD-binding subunit